MLSMLSLLSSLIHCIFFFSREKRGKRILDFHRISEILKRVFSFLFFSFFMLENSFRREEGNKLVRWTKESRELLERERELLEDQKLAPVAIFYLSSRTSNVIVAERTVAPKFDGNLPFCLSPYSHVHVSPGQGTRLEGNKAGRKFCATFCTALRKKGARVVNLPGNWEWPSNIAAIIEILVKRLYSLPAFETLLSTPQLELISPIFFPPIFPLR